MIHGVFLQVESDPLSSNIQLVYISLKKTEPEFIELVDRARREEEEKYGKKNQKNHQKKKQEHTWTIMILRLASSTLVPS